MALARVIEVTLAVARLGSQSPSAEITSAATPGQTNEAEDPTMNTGHDQQTSARRRRRVVMTRPWSPGLRLAAAALVTGGAVVVPMLATATPAAAATITTTFNYSSNYQSFTVPAGATALFITVDGGSGANGQGSYGGGYGEPGSKVEGDLAVTPGEVLTLWVGGAGQANGGQGFGSPTHNDFEGGSGGSSYGPGTGNGGGGAGASYLEANGKIVMLGGGGGGGGGSGAYLGFGGGNASPGAYYPAPDPIYPDTYGVTDAAAYSGGDSTAGGNPDATNSDNGGAGGDGGNGFYFGGGGGGGGGGYAVCDPVNTGCWSAGGGGGGAGSSFATSGDGGGGGAGGNSFADPSLTGVTFGTSGSAGADTAGQITIQYGLVSSTTVTNVTGAADPGQPVTFHAFVDPTDGGGTVTFSSGGTTISGCANLPFISGGGTDWEAVCTTSSLPAGSGLVTATYSGDSTYAGSSGWAGFTNKYTTSTSLTASPADPEVNARVTLTADVNNGDGGGSVAFTVGGTALPGCSDVSLGTSGTVHQATCTASWSQAASYPVVATYSGDGVSAGSSASADVNVSPLAATTTALSLSATKVTYGDEQAEHVSVTVSPQYSGTPGGTVTVKSGTTTVCTITLGSGKGGCTLAATRLPAGTQHLTASYNGSADFGTSASAAGTLTVAKATSKTALSLSATKVTYGDEQAERLTVTVSPQYGGTPGGTVTVKSGTVTVCTITLASGKG
ncbi:MAG: pentapeptide repeat protein, partial [Actinomycetia bacterium]|nr:pentapeptide repeat protein [Actinomycetes bacterium]